MAVAPAQEPLAHPWFGHLFADLGRFALVLTIVQVSPAGREEEFIAAADTKGPFRLLVRLLRFAVRGVAHSSTRQVEDSVAEGRYAARGCEWRG